MTRRLLISYLLLIMITPLSVYGYWEIMDIPTDRGFTAIWALDEQRVFSSGDEGLWKTFDGKTWAIDSGYQSSMIYFLNDTLGFLNGEILTTDGGKTWQKGDTVNGHGIQQIFFPPDQSSLGYGVPYIGEIRMTTDGGWHWSKLPPFPDVYAGYEEDVIPYRISFPSNPDTGYVTVNCTKIINDSTFEFHTSYFKTTDGGETWVLNEEGLWNDDFNPHHIAFPQNASVGYMAGGGKVFKTTNGGATWDTVLKDRPYIVSMCFPENDQVGYVFGDSVAHKTTDGGKTWKAAYLTHDSTFYECHFINNRVGFVTGHKNMTLFSIPHDPGFVLKTTDGLLGIAEDEWVDVKPGLIEVVSPPIGSEVTLRYSDHPQGFHAQVYDASGRKVDELHSSLTDGTVNWGGGRPCGVYFIRPVETEKTRPLRVVLVR